MKMRKVKCPLCKGEGWERIFNTEIEEKQDQTCTLCWGDLVVEKFIADAFKAEEVQLEIKKWNER